MLDWVAADDLVDHVDPVQYSLRLLVPPGSLLVDHPGMRPHLGALVEADFSYEWRHPDPRMEALQAGVAALIAESAPRAEDPAVTFDRVRGPGRGRRRAARAPAPLAPRLAPDRRAPAAPHRALVLLSGAHQGPVGPYRIFEYSSDLDGCARRQA